ncbi:acyl-CoA carboxylase subunit epsilon [Nocardioides sp. W7]|uniref:acyl-CoA carboxylase subunit epsilon n=1 Tax=Nocardioides sp. W7 TaxID=2931390 RepID=UPI001FD51E4F|nr:acyl-CoA carboxylase subunit epsilon [Nocardioides sp. W7]
MSGTEDSASAASSVPFLRVVDAHATPEEVAAIVAVLSSLGGGAPAPKRPVPAWAARHRQVRRTLPHGRGGWRASTLPG